MTVEDLQTRLGPFTDSRTSLGTSNIANLHHSSPAKGIRNSGHLVQFNGAISFSERITRETKRNKVSHCQNSTKFQEKNRRNRGKFDTPKTQIHDHSLSWIGSGTSIKVEVLN